MDFEVSNHFTIYLLTPVTDAAQAWVEEFIQDDAATMGRSVVVEHRYICGIIDGILDYGLTVSVDGVEVTKEA